MEAVVTILTDEHESSTGAIRFTGVAATGTRLTAIVGIHFDRHTRSSQSLVRNGAVQFSECPLRGVLVGIEYVYYISQEKSRYELCEALRQFLPVSEDRGLLGTYVERKEEAK